MFSPSCFQGTSYSHRSHYYGQRKPLSTAERESASWRTMLSPLCDGEVCISGSSCCLTFPWFRRSIHTIHMCLSLVNQEFVNIKFERWHFLNKPVLSGGDASMETGASVLWSTETTYPPVMCARAWGHAILCEGM